MKEISKKSESEKKENTHNINSYRKIKRSTVRVMHKPDNSTNSNPKIGQSTSRRIINNRRNSRCNKKQN